MALNIGQVLQERYRIDALLGHGGMGAVYRATDLRFRAPVAIKENLQATAEAQRQFAREAELLYRLRHPNLPRVIDHFSIPGQGQYLIMDYVEGEDLNQLLSRQRVLPENQALDWIGQVLEALEYLHKQNILHRDVKPANVKITPQGQVFLVDFGLAKASDPALSTTVGARGVTPGYAPPEQYGMGRTDARTDVYSAGATLYALLTGKVPPDALECMMRRAELIPLRQLNPAISPEVEAAIQRAMQPAPDDRFQTAAQFRMGLTALPVTRLVPAKEALPRPAIPPSAHGIEVPRGGRSPWPAWFWPAVGAAAVLLLVTVIAVAGSGGKGKQTAVPWPTPTAMAIAAATATPRTPEVPPPPTTPPRPTDTPPPPAPSCRGRIAFQSLRNGNDDIYVMNADGSGLTRLTEDPGADWDPNWSPDGKRIAFASNRDGNWEIYVMNADGTGQANLTNHAAQEDMYLDWSPDGTRIVFYSNRDNKRDIYVMNADGSGVTQLTSDPGLDYYPNWSPDGRRIAFTSDRDGNQEIYLMNVDGSGVTRLTNDPADDWLPAWSPDGKRIAFNSSRDGNQEIYAMSADGSDVVRLTSNGADDYAAAWSPDGMCIAFHSYRDSDGEIYVMNADGTGQTNLTQNPARDTSPDWFP
jgi:Tol biopolymer transport system component